MSKKPVAKKDKLRGIPPRVCHGCLSMDRELRNINEYDELYQIIIDNRLFDKKKKVLLCWECVTVLKKMKLFKEQVRHAANILLLQKNKVLITEPKCLSKLSKCIGDYELKQIVEDDKSYVDVKNVDVKSDVYIPIDNVNVNVSTSEGTVNVSTSEAKVECVFDGKIEVKQEVNDEDDYIDDPNYEDLFEIKTEDTLQEKKPKTTNTYSKFPRHEKYTWVKDYKKDLTVKVKCSDVTKCMEMERQSKHFSEAKFRCDKCLVVFKSEELLVEHGRVHDISLPYICVHCESCFASDTELKKHAKSHLFCYQCRACDFQCHKRNSINKHVKSHRGCIRCNFCGHIERNVRSFYNNHYKKYHMDYICDYCNKKRTNKESIEKHIRMNHMSAKCSICGIRLKHVRLLKQHHRRVHTVTRDERAFCVACDKQFDNELKFLAHFNKIHRRHGIKKELKCPDCDRVYTRRNYLNNHYKLEHQKKTDHFCNICNKYFLNSWKFKQHMWYTHEGRQKEKHCLCTICGRGFSEAKILQKHMRTHTNSRPYECPYCPAAYNQCHPLKKHLLTHNHQGPFPYFIRNGVVTHISQRET